MSRGDLRTRFRHMGVDLEEKQRILEIADVRGRLEHLQSLMDGEIDLFQVEKRIRGRVKKQMEKPRVLPE